MFKVDQISLRAFIASLIIHASILTLFVFTFTAEPLPPKPLVTFLGSILPNRDLIVMDEAYQGLGSDDMLKTDKEKSFFDIKENESESHSFAKPSYLNAIPKMPKEDGKTLFKEPTLEIPQKTTISESAIEDFIPVRKPLKLDLK